MRCNNILDAIGRTPLVRLNRINQGLKPQMYVKADYINPGGSVKDRIGVTMIDDAEKRGLLKPGGTIIEGTSGNTGMGLALVAAVRGYKMVFTITDKQSKEKVDLLKALGAEVIVCPTAVEPAQLLLGREETGAGDSEFLLSKPVRQSDESGGALCNDRAGNMGRHGRKNNAFCLRNGNGRNDQRRGKISEGKKSGDPDCGRRSGRIAVLRISQDGAGWKSAHLRGGRNRRRLFSIDNAHEDSG